MRVTITGATGFIGQHLCEALSNKVQVTALGRREVTGISIQNTTENHPHLMELSRFPEGDVFIHLGGYSAVKKNLDFVEINVNWPVRMIELAIKKNYKHFIFMSTAKVHGEYSNEALTCNSPLNPESRYSESKVIAEQALEQYEDDIAITILRPPAVYGTPAVGGFKKLIDACRYRKYMPACSITNRRSFISLYNIASAIDHCLEESELGCRSYLMHEHETLSTIEFVTLIAKSVSSSPKLIYLPRSLISGVDAIFGAVLNRYPLAAIHQNFYIESNEFEERYGWKPVRVTSDEVKHILNVSKAQL